MWRVAIAALLLAITHGQGVLSAQKGAGLITVQKGGGLFTPAELSRDAADSAVAGIDAADPGAANRAAKQIRPRRARGEIRSRAVGINFGMLPTSVSDKRPHQLALNPFDDTELVASIDRIESPGVGSTTYIGHVEGKDSSSVVLVAGDGVMIGSITTEDATYQVRYDGTTHHIQQVDPKAFPDEVEPTATPAGDLSSASAISVSNLATNLSTNLVLALTPTRIDIMVLYTSTARAAAGGTAAIQNLITLGVAETNQAYANSGIQQRFRLVHTREVAYAESGDVETDRNRLFNGGDGILDAAHTWRNTYGADLVQMLVDNGGGFCGMAFLNGPAASLAAQSAYAYSVTAWSCVSPNYSFGHEFGHLQGNNHAPADPTGTGAYSYSFGFKRCDFAPYFRDVMSYACSGAGAGTARSLNFSNPGVFVGGAPTGTASQDLAQSMNNTRWTIAAWRAEQPLVSITSLWPPAETAPGQSTRLWAYVVNNGPYALPANARVWFYTDGPGSGVGEGWIGSSPVAGLAPNTGAWYSFDWTKPGGVAPGAWQYQAIVYDGDAGQYLSAWSGAQAFNVPSLAASVNGYPVGIQVAGGTAKLWAYASNTGTATFPSAVYAYFWVNGPGGPNTYVGSVDVAELAPGGASWYSFDWNIPVSHPAGTYTYWAIVRYLDANGQWNDLSGWSPAQNFTVNVAPALAGRVDQLWTVAQPDGSAPAPGQPVRLWALSHNTGLNAFDEYTSVYFWVSGYGIVGSRSLMGLASDGVTWSYLDWTVPSSGSYTYWAIVQRNDGVSTTALGPWKGPQAFNVP
jgi:hypothetical protein